MSFFMSPSLQSFEMDGQLKDSDCGYIQNAAAAITSALSKYHNSTILQAVVEARVEMQAECRAEGESNFNGKTDFFPHSALYQSQQLGCGRVFCISRRSWVL